MGGTATGQSGQPKVVRNKRRGHGSLDQIASGRSRSQVVVGSFPSSGHGNLAAVSRRVGRPQFTERRTDGRTKTRCAIQTGTQRE